MDNIKIDNQRVNIPNIPNVEFQDVMVPFTGVWQSSVDPILIGFNNYQTLENMRYKKDGSGIEGIQGYSKFNNSALSYTTVNVGMQLITNKSDDSYILVHHSNSDGSNGRISYSNSSVGISNGSGSLSSLSTDTSGASNPRFSNGPGGIIAYCNEKDTTIWGGLYVPIAAASQINKSAISTDRGYFTDNYSQGWSKPTDVTEIVNNEIAANYITMSTGGLDGFIVYSTRRAEGITVTITLPNSNAANTNAIKVQTWDGNKFIPVTSLIDGTSKMTQSGTLTFDNSGSEEPWYYEERYLFVYLVSMDATSGTSLCHISELSLQVDMKTISNVWDGIYRQPIQAQLYDGSSSAYLDYSLHVNESSTEQTPVGMYLGMVSTSDRIYFMFEEPLSVIKFVMVGSLVNTANAQINNLWYYNGSTFTSVTFTDDTLDSTGDSSFAKSGSISWEPQSNEKPITLFGITGYAYELSVDAVLSGSNPEDIVIDLVGGIPARKEIKTYKFPAVYKNRLLMCGYAAGHEINRIDYSVDNAPDVFNGSDSSNDGGQSIYVGSGDELTAAIQLYNRFGSNIYSVLVITKNSETWLLTGTSPEDFQLYPISFNLGCPAFNTLTVAEVGFTIGDNVERNVALWISQQGPVMFDGAVIHPIEGLETYFDPNSSKYITKSILYKSQAWFDNNYHEWNVLLPTASSSTLNTWLVFNIRQNKWFVKNINSNQDILCGIPAIDSTGYRYVYGGSDDGRLYLLESGNSWDGNAITYKVKSGDFFPTNNQWDISLIRRLKLITKTSNTANTSLNVFMYKDLGSNSVSNSFVDLTTSSTRLTKSDININQVGWCHAIELELTSNAAPKGFEPIMIGYQYQPTRKDIK